MKKFFIKTYGCQSNIADSEQIAGLVKEKYKIVNSVKEADMVIVNSCNVKLTTQNKELDFIKKIPKNKKLFVGGCLPSVLDLRKYSDNITAIFNTNSILKILEIIKKEKDELSEEKEKRINISRVRKNKNIGIINVSQGCLGNCSYCSVKLARGQLKSYSIKDVKRELKTVVGENCKKIYLTGQDLGCYGLDIKTNFPYLLKGLVKVKGDYKIRIGMVNPNYALRYLDKLIKIYKSDKIIKFLHVPCQSFSDKIIKDMDRNYSYKDFKNIVTKFRKEIPDINIVTDLIAGYPTETEKDFDLTLKRLKEIKPEVLNISKFSSRPKTKAAKLKQLKTEIIKERSRRLTELWNEIKPKI